MPSMENTRGSSWQPSLSLDRASVDGYTNAHRDMPASSRGGEWTRRREPAGPSSEDGTESSRRRQRRTPEVRSKEQAMWPNPWMRTHWDPENPLDLNKPIRDEDAPLDGDELETRAFQPAFPMDLNHLVQSLWTPKPPPPPSPSVRPQQTTRQMPQMRRQRSGSPSPPAPSSSLSSSYEMPSSVRDGRHQAPMYDDRRFVDEYEFRSRHREMPQIDPRMSADKDAWSRRQQAGPRQTANDELRSRAAPPGPGYYEDRDYSSSRRQRPYPMSDRQADLSRDFGQQPSRHRAPQDRRYDDPYRGYSSEDNARAPAVYRESHDGGRRHPFTMDAREAAREAEAAAMARLSQDRFDGRGVDPHMDPRLDPRMDPRAGPQLRRVVSAPSADLLRPERRHEPRYHRDERGGQVPAPFLTAHPRGGGTHDQQQQQQQRGPTLARAQSEGSLDDEEGYDV